MITVLTIQNRKVVGEISGFDTITEAAQYIATLPTLPAMSYAIQL